MENSVVGRSLLTVNQQLFETPGDMESWQVHDV